jgi:hypothetical protein
MKIFISCRFLLDKDFYDELVEFLNANGHNAYPKQLWGFFGERGLPDPDELDEHLRDEDLAIAMMSQHYMSDRWLREELHALYTLAHKLRPNFLLPIFLKDIGDFEIPQWCFVIPHVDFRNRPYPSAFADLLKTLGTLAPKRRVSVFVSYNKKDELIATRLSTLLSKAFNLLPEDIVCTGVEGHRLPLSANTDETLRRLVREAKVFVCIATKNSIGTIDEAGSFYVAAELGARWGMKRYLALLLARGTTGNHLKAPFTTLNALSCDDRGQIQQFIREIAPILGRDPLPPEAYQSLVDDLVQASTVDGR